MSSEGKRFLASLFGLHLNEDPPQLQSLVPQRISDEIIAGTLPKFNPTTILLGRNETCRFMDKAALAVQKTEKLYKSSRLGGSYRLAKSFTMHSSGGISRPVEQNWYEFKEGVVFVTNERIIFVAPDKGFEKKMNTLTAFIPYTDAIALQFGSQTINLMMPQPQLMAMVLQMVH